MPTGYTSKLYEGEPQTFSEFALACARAFGALVLMRDEPMDAPIPDEFHPSEWTHKHLDESKAHLDSIQGWNQAQWEAQMERDNRAALDAWEKYELRKTAIRERYQGMLRQVQAWQPPSSEHVGYKQFMVDQLRESIRFDCTPSEAPKQWSDWKTFKRDRLEAAERNVSWAQKHWDEEVERNAGRNRWIRQLRESLGGVE